MVSAMDAYRTYLRGELGKLPNRSDAKRFLVMSSYEGLGRTPEELGRRFADQTLVDAEVERMPPPELVMVTEACAYWRNTGSQAASKAERRHGCTLRSTQCRWGRPSGVLPGCLQSTTGDSWT